MAMDGKEVGFSTKNAQGMGLFCGRPGRAAQGMGLCPTRRFQECREIGGSAQVGTDGPDTCRDPVQARPLHATRRLAP